MVLCIRMHCADTICNCFEHDWQVSMPGLNEATDYIYAQMLELRDHAQARLDGSVGQTRATVHVVKHTVSGAVGMDFTGTNFTNAYRWAPTND
jgi:hypothetical protein